MYVHKMTTTQHIENAGETGMKTLRFGIDYVDLRNMRTRV